MTCNVVANEWFVDGLDQKVGVCYISSILWGDFQKRVLVYSGDVDMTCNVVANEWFVDGLDQKVGVCNISSILWGDFQKRVLVYNGDVYMTCISVANEWFVDGLDQEVGEVFIFHLYCGVIFIGSGGKGRLYFILKEYFSTYHVKEVGFHLKKINMKSLIGNL